VRRKINTSIQGKQVKCRACGREYTCTPADDYYNSTTPKNGWCTACFLKKHGCVRMIEPHEYKPVK
jgi:hypothetical protein